MTKFTITFRDGETRTVEANYIKPEILRGWWSYDADGLEEYKYGEDKIEIPLGETMYFHVEVRGIIAGRELSLQLIDYDELFWSSGEKDIGDDLDPDTKNFPNDPVILKAKVRGVTKQGELYGKSIATLEVLMDEKWEPVIADDHKGYSASRDQTIELYWEVSYTNTVNSTITKPLPKNKEDYLRVGYNDRDLYIKPAVDGSSLPEYYDKNGKLIIFAFKRAKDIATGLNPNVAIEKFIVTKFKVVETRTLSEINKVKRELYYERINLNTNDSKRMLYVTEEASEFYIKGTASFTDVTNTEIKNPKKFSEYFNKKDAGDIATVGLKEGRKILRFLDYVSVTQTLISMFPKEGSISLEVPKPSSAAGIISTFATGELTWALSGALSALFMVADVIATQEVNKILNEFGETARQGFEAAKFKGLNNALAYVQNSQGAKMLQLGFIEFVSQTACEKLLRGEFSTFQEFQDYKSSPEDNYNNYYACFFYVKIENGRKKHLIDSIFLR
ncbi:hypothetical protein ACSTS3_07935 [Aquimarina muelleri]|uniref:hypothetical protein n=1 Tax=Aquimarina muelleri TaxID=279356 RepID=UPI003F6842F8